MCFSMKHTFQVHFARENTDFPEWHISFATKKD